MADVVIEAFACEIPADYVAAMETSTKLPVWINLEYLSAEAWVNECHGLPSHQSRSRLLKYFFFPGFTCGTGGLLRESGLLEERTAFDMSTRRQFWQRLEQLINQTASPQIELCDATETELCISLFCYENPALPELLEACASGLEPVQLLVFPGTAAAQVGAWFGSSWTTGQQLRRGGITATALPFVSQTDYDRVLWSCDVNFVRGEDSFVRAQWAHRAFLWQIYPQQNEAHLVKLNAFLSRYLRDFDRADVVRSCFDAWNGQSGFRDAWEKFLRHRQSIELHGDQWVRELDRAGNLADNLTRFVSEIKVERGLD